MVNGSQYYTALESVSIASPLSSALTIFPRQIRVLNADSLKLQHLTARIAGHSGQFTPGGYLSTL